MKPIIELSGLLSFRLFKTYLPLAHHSSWNVLEEINAARTQMPTLIQRHDAVWMKLRTQASLYQITSLLFMNMEGKGKEKNQLWLQGVIIKTHNRETHNSILVISPYKICMIMYYWIKTYNVLRGFGILHLLRQLDISQCSLMLYPIPHLSLSFSAPFCFFSENWLYYLPSPYRQQQMNEFSRSKLCIQVHLGVMWFIYVSVKENVIFKIWC